jgi:hypothetical protein
MAETETNPEVEKVTLVALDTITPYRKGEVFTVNRVAADKLLTRDNSVTDFGPRNERVKVRLFDPLKDEQLLLDNHVLNAVEHRKLEKKLHGENK